MRLVKSSGDGIFSLTEDLNEDLVPPYAILSHRWRSLDVEVLYKDFHENCAEDKVGYDKIRFCGQQAARDGLEYFWIDTCGINKADFTELSKSISCMFKWYRKAVRCYVYLQDVPDQNARDAFLDSDWFDRGWTLQELLAPSKVEFYAKNGDFLGDKTSLEDRICQRTGIARDALRGTPLSHFSVDERIGWATRRQTTVDEDFVYCLLGIFDVQMPLIYGEGRQKALNRLHREIRWSAEEIQMEIPTDMAVRTISSTAWSLVKRPEWAVLASRDRTNAYEYLQQLSTYDPERRHRERASRRLKHTTMWILKEPNFVSWLHEKEAKCLWLTGIIGCGKSITIATIIDRTISVARESQTPTLHFFFDHSSRTHLTARALFESYVKQLLCYLENLGQTSPRGIAAKVADFYGQKQPPPTLTEVVDELLVPLTKGLDRLFLIVDGLDECDDKEVQAALMVFKRLLLLESVRVFISCREDVNVSRVLPGTVRIRISPENVQDDLEAFIDNKLKTKQAFYQISDDLEMLSIIKHELMTKADRMFLWAQMQIDLLWDTCSASGHDDKAIIKLLSALPERLGDIYRNCLEQANRNQTDDPLAKKVLRLVYAAPEPFSICQLQEGLMVDVLTGKLAKTRFSRDAIKRSCSNLVYTEMLDDDELNDDQLIMLAHCSVRQFLHIYLDEEEEETKLRLGELCVVHLHLNMPSQDVVIRRTVNVPVQTNMMSAIIQKVVPMVHRPQSSRPVKQATLRLPAPTKSSVSWDNYKTFFHFARLHWTSLTRELTRDSPTWLKFEKLALLNNKEWWVCPWPNKYPDSFNAHMAAMYSWSIVHKHYGLLALALSQRRFVPADMYRLPLCNPADTIQGRALLPLQVAARFGDARVFELMLNVHQLQDLTVGCPSLWSIASLAKNEDVLAFLRSHDVKRFTFCLSDLEDHIFAFAFSPDGRMITTGHRSGLMRSWNLNNGKRCLKFEGHKTWVSALAYSPNGSFIVSGSIDGTVRLWDATLGSMLDVIIHHNTSILTVSFSSEGRHILSTDKDGAIFLRRLMADVPSDYHQAAITPYRPGQSTLPSDAYHPPDAWDHDVLAEAVSLLPDARYLARGKEDGSIWIRRLDGFPLPRYVAGHEHRVRRMSYSFDGSLLVSNSMYEIKVWKAASGELLRIVKPAAAAFVRSVSVLPDGKQIIAHLSNGTIQWLHSDLKNFCKLYQLEHDKHDMFFVLTLLSPDGQRIAVRDQARQIFIYDLECIEI